MRRSIGLAAALTVAAIAGAALLLPQRHDAGTMLSGPPASAAPATPAPALQATEGAAAPLRLAQATAAAPESREEIRLSFAPIVKRVAPAVVNVYATSRVQIRSPFEGDPFFERFFGASPFGAPRERLRSSLGSGVIVDKSGVIVTNNHVVGDATEIKVALSDGRELPAEILIKDERTDLAVLKVENGGDLPALEMGDSDTLEVGDLVLAVGDPFGVGQTVTSGIVSALARTNIGINDAGFFIQTDAAINPGNSGGPLVDLEGKVIGINTAIYSRTGGSIGIGFAIPSNMVRIVVSEAVAGSKTVARPWIGVVCQDLTPEIASSLGLAAPRGALVTHIDEGSPAEKAGLKVGDLILKAGDSEIGDTATFDYRLTVAGIGSPVALTVWRDGAESVVDVVAEAEPELSESDLTLIGGRSPLTGAVVADLNASLADRMRIRGAEAGAVIVDIEPMSPAARMGFRRGDVVLGAQGEDVTTADQLARLVEEDSRLWRIKFSRDGRVSSIVIGG
jgi:Do/DeqQ family serine protease